MRWVLLDVVLCLFALAVLAALALRLWRQVTALGREVAGAGSTMAGASDALAATQGSGPLGARTRPGDAGDGGFAAGYAAGLAARERRSR